MYLLHDTHVDLRARVASEGHGRELLRQTIAVVDSTVRDDDDDGRRHTLEAGVESRGHRAVNVRHVIIPTCLLTGVLCSSTVDLGLHIGILAELVLMALNVLDSCLRLLQLVAQPLRVRELLGRVAATLGKVVSKDALQVVRVVQREVHALQGVLVAKRLRNDLAMFRRSGEGRVHTIGDIVNV